MVAAGDCDVRVCPPVTVPVLPAPATPGRGVSRAETGASTDDPAGVGCRGGGDGPERGGGVVTQPGPLLQVVVTRPAC